MIGIWKPSTIILFFWFSQSKSCCMQNEVELTTTNPTEPPQAETQPVAVPPAIPTETPQPVTVEEEKAPEPAAEPSKEWENVDSFANANASFMSSIINTTNTVIGAGILSIAFSIKNAGVLGSILLIAVVLTPSLVTSYYLSVATVYTKEEVYGDIGTKLYNKAVGIFTNVTQILLDFGIDVAYMMVLFNQIIDITRELFSIELIDYKTVWIIKCFS